MDPLILAGMIFSLVVLAMIGSFVLLFPISRLLGRYLQQRMEAGWSGQAVPPKLIQRLERIERHLARMRERQDFVEALLEGREDPLALPPGELEEDLVEDDTPS